MDLRIYNISKVIPTAGRNQSWVSWTRGKSRGNYSNAKAPSIVRLITTRVLAIGTGEDDLAKMRGSIFASKSDGKDDGAELGAGFDAGIICRIHVVTFLALEFPARLGTVGLTCPLCN
jgi:hypothetical protein